MAWRLLRDRRVPWYAKLMLPLVFLYLASPLDLVPDFIPVLGYLDDLLLVALALGLFIRLCPAGVVEEQAHRWRRSRHTPVERGRPLRMRADGQIRLRHYPDAPLRWSP